MSIYERTEKALKNGDRGELGDVGDEKNDMLGLVGERRAGN
jgi:hypothetical protein